MLQIFFELLWKGLFYVTGNFFTKLAMAITNSKEMKSWLTSEEIRG